MIHKTWLGIEYLRHVVLIATKEAISTSPFLSIFIDEIIIIDNQSWVSIHCHVEEG